MYFLNFCENTIEIVYAQTLVDINLPTTDIILLILSNVLYFLNVNIIVVNRTLYV